MKGEWLTVLAVTLMAAGLAFGLAGLWVNAIYQTPNEVDMAFAMTAMILISVGFLVGLAGVES